MVVIIPFTYGSSWQQLEDPQKLVPVCYSLAMGFTRRRRTLQYYPEPLNLNQFVESHNSELKKESPHTLFLLLSPVFGLCFICTNTYFGKFLTSFMRTSSGCNVKLLASPSPPKNI